MRGIVELKNVELEARKLKRGQLLPDGIYKTYSADEFEYERIYVINGRVVYSTPSESQDLGKATKTNLIQQIRETDKWRKQVMGY
ncbi:hypothetical protein SAMN02745136_00463 [Anaerocolumna jejuensis DSM 15929]|uniref:Uncharacterized protein n=1 Tax=Anaerocolumna jejuensis DSM 15929 TaxID=1121322 RepID=A0A1M6KIC3_9FIRM|nr:hypothetical protein [Anaerocolumna jejuensis]SHJ58664.1 hypothetical protein SAMN02745136_00463 [Anaerocolumna jejuensis DSM 15929]